MADNFSSPAPVAERKKLPAAAEAFTRFLRSYIAEWAEPWNPGC